MRTARMTRWRWRMMKYKNVKMQSSRDKNVSKKGTSLWKALSFCLCV